ncbi:MAG: hypothetical protein JRD71_10050 [Deltaproteobacteria bacterium]|nr:hypothetical protein [Deltaproteobacteria bacterium]
MNARYVKLIILLTTDFQGKHPIETRCGSTLSACVHAQAGNSVANLNMKRNYGTQHNNLAL